MLNCEDRLTHAKSSGETTLSSPYVWRADTVSAVRYSATSRRSSSSLGNRKKTIAPPPPPRDDDDDDDDHTGQIRPVRPVEE